MNYSIDSLNNGNDMPQGELDQRKDMDEFIEKFEQEQRVDSDGIIENTEERHKEIVETKRENVEASLDDVISKSSADIDPEAFQKA